MIAAKILGIKAFLITGLFLLAKKALIISKVALLIAGIVAIKKLVAVKTHKAGVYQGFAEDQGDFVGYHDKVPLNAFNSGIYRRSGVNFFSD